MLAALVDTALTTNLQPLKELANHTLALSYVNTGTVVLMHGKSTSASSTRVDVWVLVLLPSPPPGRNARDRKTASK